MLFPSPLNKLYSAVSLFVVLTILLAACQGQPFVTEVFETETPVTANTTQEPSATETATVEANEEVASPTPINVDEVPPPWERYSIPSVRVLPLENLWDRIAKADGLVVIGLKDDFARGYFQGKVLVKPSQVEKLKEVLYTETPGLHRPPDNLQFIPPLASGLIPPWVTARLDSMDTLQNVLNLAFVEFVEPAFFLMDSLACTQDPYTTTRGSANLSDSLGDIINYNFPILGINTAWNRAYPIEPGLSMGIAVIDSGASTEQDQLNDRFALFGNATIRPIATHLTATGITPGDQCGHGTRIAGLASAPRDGKNIVGVAWAAPLTTIKITNNPIVFGGPSHMGNVLAICDAISKASSGGSRVISMAFGMDYTSPTIETCIRDAYSSFPEKIFVAAAGTTFSWVVFPAEMPEVIAVSLVEINSASGGYKMFPLGTVAYGPAVDFVIPVTRDWTASTGKQSSDIWSLGGSSSATAIMTGLVSFVWSQFPGESREQIISRLRSSASLAGITDSGGNPPYAEVGYGIPNAYLAVGGTTSLAIEGPTQATPSQTVRLIARPNGTDPLNYTWSTGITNGQSTDITLGSTGSTTVTIMARDPKDGNTISATHTIDVVSAVNPPANIILYSADIVSEYPVFFDGSSGDHTLDGGVTMPPGCKVLAVKGVRLCYGPWRTCTPESTFQSGGSTGWSWGFSISRDLSLAANDLGTQVHWWHDGVNEIRVRAVYNIEQPAGVSCSVPGKTQSSPL